MALANPAARFNRAQSRPLDRTPHQRRNVCVLQPTAVSGDRKKFISQCVGNGHTHYTRDRVADAVARGEMVWADRHCNAATFTTQAAGTWQKCQSGPVCTMQLRVGSKGRHVPVDQREPVLSEAEFA